MVMKQAAMGSEPSGEDRDEWPLLAEPREQPPSYVMELVEATTEVVPVV